MGRSKVDDLKRLGVSQQKFMSLPYRLAEALRRTSCALVEQASFLPLGRHKSTVLAVWLIVISVWLCVPRLARAQVTYTYTGNPFSISQCEAANPPDPDFPDRTVNCISGNITASATFDQPGGQFISGTIQMNAAGQPQTAYPSLGPPPPTFQFNVAGGDVEPSRFGTAIVTEPNMLATGGRVVSGVGADGVAEIVLRLPAPAVGDQITVYLSDESGNFSSTNDDGALGNPGDTSFSDDQITVTAQSTSAGPMGFAVYRAPIDFVRTNNTQDESASSRTITVTATDADYSATSTTDITILRPPMVLVHGIWGSPSDWNEFSPLIKDPSNRFAVYRANYSIPITSLITSFTPTPPSFINQVTLLENSNSLGFAYNAPAVLNAINFEIGKFINGNNPLNIAVADVQADIVGHSMGGDIARYLPLLPNFYDSVNNFALGPVHKVITIDTPHLGSQLAYDLLQPANACVQDIFILIGRMPYQNVSFGLNGTVASGAINDLSVDPNGLLSPALNAIHQSTIPRLPTALIAATMESSQLDPIDSKGTVGSIIKDFCGGSPLANDFTSVNWPTVFGGLDSDAIVSLNSQLDGLSSGTPFTAVHSDGATALGFGGPTVFQQSSGVPQQVINLLNTSVTNSSTYQSIP